MSKDTKIQQLLDTFTATVIEGETGEKFEHRINKLSHEIDETSHGKRKDVNVIEEIARTHIYNTEVVLENLDIGINGLLNNPKAKLYYKGYGSQHATEPIFTSSHIQTINIEIDLKTVIIDGYRGKNYWKNEEIARELADKMAKKYCCNVLEDSQYEVTSKMIKLSITGINENIGIFNFTDYGIEMDKYINYMHKIMKESRINRADVKFIFDNGISIVPAMS